ncbi:peptide chain release factor N(5)-glutamine methyltransferase [uncultured Microbulbifer sp.]|uniref:peptide chain release factor N(5)-glutamine methyltransferase n=1 Tax=uncultured Microbulbifer sp. TaxID=348147 RepID=UPI0025D61B4F|nr:peptide chain release factor N(5)-glutamine methyltransferase [uncultured Microbulbifer sp.]
MASVKENLLRAAELTESDSPRLDLEVLLCHLLGKSRAWLYTWPEHELEPEQQAAFDRLFERRIAGEPVAHLTGNREFWSLPLKVNRSTLIPRPDTEVLVEAVLELRPQESLRALDLGTGTGAIALALATEKPHWQLLAVDKMPAAVALAEENRQQLGLANVQVRQSDWFDGVPPQHFDVIVSNPPYIDAQDPHLREGDVRFEPRSALVADEQGLADIRQIAAQARSYLAADGLLLVEHGWQQADAVAELLGTRGFEQVQSWRDLGGQQRVTGGQWRG